MRKDISLGHQNKINGAWIHLALEKAFELYGMDYDCLIITSKIILKRLREKHFLDILDPLRAEKILNIPFICMEDIIPHPDPHHWSVLAQSHFHRDIYMNREILPLTEFKTQIFTPYPTGFKNLINGYWGALDDRVNDGRIAPQHFLSLGEILKWMGEVKHYNRIVQYGRRGSYVNVGNGAEFYLHSTYREVWIESLSGRQSAINSVLDMPETPRSSYLKEQYFRADGNVRELNKIYPNKSPAEITKMVEDYNVKTGLWVIKERKTLINGREKITHSFKKNQDNIKYYKDYLKIQLHLEISPSIDYKQKRKIINRFNGTHHYEVGFKRGFCLGIWDAKGIGDREAFTTSSLNYYGREGIFKKDGDSFVRVRDGQYLIKN
jgi:hypothetical protein